MTGKRPLDAWRVEVAGVGAGEAQACVPTWLLPEAWLLLPAF
jgi:hypothetical protein